MSARLVEEKETHFLVDFGEEKPVVIAKAKLSPDVLKKIRGYQEGGSVKQSKKVSLEEDTPAGTETEYLTEAAALPEQPTVPEMRVGGGSRYSAVASLRAEAAAARESAARADAAAEALAAQETPVWKRAIGGLDAGLNAVFGDDLDKPPDVKQATRFPVTGGGFRQWTPEEIAAAEAEAESDRERERARPREIRSNNLRVVRGHGPTGPTTGERLADSRYRDSQGLVSQVVPEPTPEEAPQIELTPEQLALQAALQVFDQTYGTGTTRAPQIGLPGDAPILDTGAYDEATAARARAVAEEGRIKAEHAAAEAELQQDFLDVKREAFEADRLARRAILDEQRDMYERAMRDEIDPDRYMKSLGSDGQTQAAFAILLGGLAQGAVLGLTGHDPGNTALKMLEKSIDRDIDAQMQNRTQRNAMLSHFRQLGLDKIQGLEWERATRATIEAGKLTALAAEYGSPAAIAASKALESKILQGAAFTKTNIMQQNIGNWEQAEDRKLRVREANLRAKLEAQEFDLKREGARAKLVADVVAGQDDKLDKMVQSGAAITAEERHRLPKETKESLFKLSSVKDEKGKPLFVLANGDQKAARDLESADAKFLRTVNNLDELIKFADENPNLPNKLTDASELGKAQQRHFDAFWEGLRQYRETMGRVVKEERLMTLEQNLPAPDEWMAFGADKRKAMYRQFRENYILAHKEGLNAGTVGSWGDQIKIAPKKTQVGGEE